MNEKFFSLPQEKQQAIINAGYRVFSRNSYRKSPMSEIADAAGISKSLLFHYFRNKKELYLFLWDTCAQLTLEVLRDFNCYEGNDLFEIMRKGLEAKISLMRRYPDLGAFALKCYYEKDPEVQPEMQRLIEKYGSYKNNAAMQHLSPDQFIPGLDLEMMYQEMFWTSEGFLWERLQEGELDIEGMNRDFGKMIDFWKQLYTRKEGSCGSHQDEPTDQVLREVPGHH